MRDKGKTAFTCHRGLYEYVMPFGLVNAPGVFQKLMSVVLQDLGKFAMAYLDDIITFSPSMEENIKHIQLVFDRLRQHQLKLKISKCKFMQEETQYLGFIINRQGIMTDPDKVQVIKNINPPNCVREVRSFIGMCNYYRSFFPNFSAKAKPLIKLTRKFAKFEWNKECQAAFDHLKECLTTSPLLYIQTQVSHTFFILILVMIVLVHASVKPMKKERNQFITYLTSLLLPIQVASY